MDKISSLRHMEKIPSKRWSLIKETAFMNIQGEKPRDDMISINCLPFKEKDAIVDFAENESKKIESSKSV
jgi:hypothetical protein